MSLWGGMGRLIKDMKIGILGVLAASALLLVSTATASTLETVKERGKLKCGVSTGLPGFSNLDEQGVWQGFDVDGCRAVAAAVLGDAKKVEFVPLDTTDRFAALQSGDIDVLIRGTTWTFKRDTALGVRFAGVSFYDTQAVMVRKKSEVESVSDLGGIAICLQPGTTTKNNITAYFAKNHLELHPVFFNGYDEMINGFQSGRCDALTSDRSQLHALRTRLAHPEEVVILPEGIAKEPLGPVVRQGDDGWFSIVRWCFFSIVYAEELGVDSGNVSKMKSIEDPAVKRLLGLEGMKGESLGLADDWAFQIIRQVGNYKEIYDRNVGMASPLKMKRGLNNLWNKGGLHYSPPM